ncbi:MAG: hypothetical protein KBT88_13190 [Gammaproteobacteria bacterium]|nr:hypothetical protein [Gammaproteobacteria bacterium]MBQ0840732.1 hypothetical protein [Gammaproteobacteria bacterium]
MMDIKLTSKDAMLTGLPLKPWRFAEGLIFVLLVLGFGIQAAADTTRPAAGARHHSPARHTGVTPAALAPYYATLQGYEAEGPYHQNASEVLHGLGLELQKHGQHTKALKALRRAMHINRVNSGLNSLSQAPMLRSIINSQKNLLRFEPVTSSYNQLLRMHTATYGKHDPRIAPLLNELALWHLDAYRFDEKSNRIDHLTSAYSLVTSALELSETRSSPEPREQIGLLRSAALINFHLSRHEGDEWSASTNSHYSLSADGFATANPQRTGILSGASFRRGRVCHERIMALTAAIPEVSLEEKLQAQAELADWYLVFNHRAEAMAHYQQVLAQIVASDQPTELHAKLFSTPRLLPAMRMENHHSTGSTLFMTADVDISEKGWGSQIENIGDTLFPGQRPPSNNSLHYMMVDTIKGSRFRPQFVDNKAAEVSNVAVKIPLLH